MLVRETRMVSWKDQRLTIVIQQLLDQIHVSQDHSPTAIPLQSKVIHGIAFANIGLQQSQICFPLVPDNFAAGEAPHWNDHDVILLTCSGVACRAGRDMRKGAAGAYAQMVRLAN